MPQELQQPDSQELIVEGTKDYQDMEREVTNIFGNAFVHTVNSLNAQSDLKNVAIFVDYDNVYWTLNDNHQHDPDDPDPAKNLFVRLWDTYGRDHIRTFRAYADFQKLDRSNLTSLQKKRIQIRHVYSNGKDADGRKNSSDIELCIDAIESTYKDESISCYVFVTADSDMIPILSRMMYKGKRVELYYLKEASPKHVDLATFAHKAVDLVEFLGIEQREYEIDQFLIPALRFINEWHQKPQNSNRWLGYPILKDDLSSNLSIPKQTVSQVIEQLQNKGFIHEEIKETNRGPKRNVCLTTGGKELVTITPAEVAASSAVQEASGNTNN